MRFLLLLLLSLCLMEVSAYARESVSVRVMTFNLRYDGGAGKPSDKKDSWLANSGEHRRDLVFQVIADKDPDILCVQEALKNQADDLQLFLESYKSYGVGREDGVDRGEQCRIFYRANRFTRIDQGTFWLNARPDQPGTRFPKTCCPRIASWVVLKDKHSGGREYFLLNTHWDHREQAAREYAAKLIRERTQTTGKGRAVIVTGDFNVLSKNKAVRLLTEADQETGFVLQDSYRSVHPKPRKDEGTNHRFRGNNDGPRIDYVLHDQSFRTKSAQILRTHRQNQYPSDHFPVTATLLLQE